MARSTSPEADDDFARIYLHGVETFGTAQAERYALAMLDAFDMLGDKPHIGRERSDLNPPVRLWPHGSHNILYVIIGSDAHILRVVHHSVEWTRLFRPQ